jgi:pimeloyl-ACP methyl ester carboxylesterase
VSGGLHVIERRPIEDGPAAGALAIFVHGSMDRGNSFRRVIARLPDFSVIIYDRRGYGGSSEVIPSVDFSTQADDLLGILASRRAVGVGHSLGGDVVLAAAERRPDLIDTTLVYEPPQMWLPWWSTYSIGQNAIEAAGENGAAAAEIFLRGMIGDAAWERLPTATRQQRQAEGAALIAEMRGLRRDAPFDPSAISIPVLVGYGTKTREHHRRGTRLLAEALPNGQLVAIPDAGHGAHLSHPDNFAQLVRQALARREGPRS